MKSENEIRQAFSEKFENYEPTPREDSWEKIRASISETDPLKQILSAKFENYETAPKDEIWEKVNASIPKSDDAIKQIFSAKFDDYEVNPADGSWNLIKSNIKSEDLLKIELSEKLQDFEAIPQRKSWNIIKENIISEDLLRLELADKFSKYEATPTDESWEIIWEAIREKKRRGIIIPLFYRVGIAASIALLVGSFWYFQNNKTVDSGEMAVVKPEIKDEKLKIKDKIESEQKVIDNQDILNNEKITKNNNFSNQKTKENNFTHNISSIAISEKQSLKTDFRKEKNEIILNEKNSISTTENLAQNQIEKIENKNFSNQLIINGLENKDFIEIATNKSFLPITFSLPDEPVEIEETRAKRPFTITTNLMPVQSYQAFTILPQTTAYIQQITSPNPIDNERLGLQAKVGLMQPLSQRNTVSATLNYTGIQQYANYEVSNGNYTVQYTDNQSYTVTQDTEQINELQFFHALGLKLENSFLVAKGKKNIYLTGGGEAIRVLTKKQNAYAVTASLGIEQKFGNKSIWIEPTFRYSLSQSSDIYNYLQIRPYQVGLNFRFNLSK